MAEASQVKLDVVNDASMPSDDGHGDEGDVDNMLKSVK